MNELAGSFNNQFKPVVQIKVEGIRVKVEFMIDTGFNGYMMLPPDKKPKGVSTLGTESVHLGDSSEVTADICYVTLYFLDEWITVLAHLLEGCIPAIGNQLLRKLNLHINYIEQMVTISKPAS